MNFNFGSSSSVYSDDSSSPEGESRNSILEDLDRDDEIIRLMIQNNNHMIEFLTNNQQIERPRGGSVFGHRVLNRHREEGHANLMSDYFSEGSTYGVDEFHRRFHMHRHLFLRIVDDVQNHDHYFQQRRDAVNAIGHSALQKSVAAIRMLAYGSPADSTDEYLRIGESTAIESMKRFCRAIVEIYGERYLRSPTADDISRLLSIGEQRGFPGMLGSLDCMHWKWKNCPTGWAGQYSGRSGSPTIILEAVADYDLRIWHAYFGMPGTNNDINVLEASHLFSNLTQGIAPTAHYSIKGKEYNMGYYLADGIYPKWSTLVQTIRNPSNAKERHFSKKQEACRKDVERAFGVLQQKFHIIAGPGRFWKKEVLHDIMMACIILHNMIIEDERRPDPVVNESRNNEVADVERVENDDERFQQFLGRYRKIRDRSAHFELRAALVDHLWEHLSTSNEEN